MIFTYPYVNLPFLYLFQSFFIKNCMRITILNGFFRGILTYFFVENGYSVDVRMINAYNYKLKEFGEYLYDHVVVFCTSEPGSIFKNISLFLCEIS